jgi:hypothetical protein
MINDIYQKKQVIKTERSISLGSEGRISRADSATENRICENQSIMKAMDRKMFRGVSNSSINEVSRKNYTLEQAE